MAKRKRDFAAEYKRRVWIGKRRGLSKSQIRGHARADEVPVAKLKSDGVIRPSNAAIERRYYKAIEKVAGGASLSEAAKASRISTRSIKKLDKDRELLIKDVASGRFRVEPYVEFGLFAKDPKTKELIAYKSVPLDRYNASIVGKHWNAAQAALDGSNPRTLKGYRNVRIKDIHGRSYLLVSDVNDVRAIQDQMSSKEAADFNEKLYRPIRNAT